MTTILIVEDEQRIAEFVSRGLQAAGYKTEIVDDGLEALERAQQPDIDLVLLDIGLPSMDGLEVLRELRGRGSAVPVIMLTARSQETDKIRGLDAGADDYVTKPFSVGELVARINAMFRRLHRGTATANERIEIGGAVVDPHKHELTRKGKTQALSFYEVELLRLLWERAGQPVTREEILEKIWGVPGHAGTRSVDNFVVKLRKKVEEDAANPKHIVTIYGTGYKLVP